MAGEADEVPKEPSQAVEDKDSSSQNRPKPDANQENQAQPAEARIINIPESPLGRIDRKLHEIKDKTDGLPFIGSRLGFTNKRKREKTENIDQGPKRQKHKELLNGVEQRLDAIERTLFDVVDILRTMEDQQTRPQLQQQGPATTQPTQSHKMDRTRRGECCPFCDGTHWASDCKTFRRLSDRRKQCKDRNRCERCLQVTSHLATSCPSNSTCFYCKKEGRTKEAERHNSAFCPHTFDM